MFIAGNFTDRIILGAKNLPWYELFMLKIYNHYILGAENLTSKKFCGEKFTHFVTRLTHTAYKLTACWSRMVMMPSESAGVRQKINQLPACLKRHKQATT